MKNTAQYQINLAFTGKLIEKAMLRRFCNHMSDHMAFVLMWTTLISLPTKTFHRDGTYNYESTAWHFKSAEFKGRGVALVLLDLSAAFDTINLDGVINTLEQHFGE